VDNACIKEFLDHFVNFIFLGKGVTIQTDIERKASRYKGNGMIINTTGRKEASGSVKDQLMFRKDGFKVLRYRGCLCCLYGMELGDNTRMTLFQQLLHAMGTNDLR
jgi:hypothetical protein